MWKPSSFGIWSATMTAPTPALKPASTGSEMKFATNPKRSAAATSKTSPTSTVSVAAAVASPAASAPGTASDSADPTRMAIVVVVLTLRTAERPRAA